MIRVKLADKRDMRPILICLFTLSSILYSQETGIDPQGWGKAKWGMTNEEIVAAFDGRVHSLANTTAPRVGIEDLELEGGHYRLIFVPDKTGGLAWVSIAPHEVPSPYKTGSFALSTHPTQAFTDLNAALIRKYGSPSAKTSEVVDGWKSVLATWRFATTIVELKMRTNVRFDGMNLIELRYRRNVSNPDL